jgi:hypothetical protein
VTRPVASHASHGSPLVVPLPVVPLPVVPLPVVPLPVVPLPVVPLPVVPLPAQSGQLRRVSNRGSRYWRPSPPQRVVIRQPWWTALRSSRANSHCPAVSARFRSQRTRRVRALSSLVGLVALIKTLFLPLTHEPGWCPAGPM